MAYLGIILQVGLAKTGWACRARAKRVHGKNARARSVLFYTASILFYTACICLHTVSKTIITCTYHVMCLTLGRQLLQDIFQGRHVQNSLMTIITCLSVLLFIFSRKTLCPVSMSPCLSVLVKYPHLVPVGDFF